MYTPITTPEARDRAETSTKILLGIEIAFGALAFWTDAIATGVWQKIVIAALLTAGFGAISALASTIVTRFAESAGHVLTRAMVFFAGGVLVIVAGGMTWHGLAWANTYTELAPTGYEWLLGVAAYGLSGLNVIALYVFTRDIKTPKAADLVEVKKLEPVPVPAPTPGQLLARQRWGTPEQRKLSA